MRSEQRTGLMLGAVLGTAVLGTIIGVRVAADLPGRLVASGVPAASVDAANQQLQVAAQGSLPSVSSGSPQADKLIRAAVGESLTSGLNVAMMVGVVLLLVAVAVASRLRAPERDPADSSG
jgi:hypothetical protein